jgi:biotin/methionine sulfoxide reductase
VSRSSGWVIRAQSNTGLDRSANPNTLTLDRGSSAFSQGCSAQTCLVDVRVFEREAPPIASYEPPAFVRRSE